MSTRPSFLTKLDPEHNSVVRLIAGQFVNDVSRVWGPDRLHEYLAATDLRRHIWHSWLAANRAGIDDRSYDFLTTQKARSIIAEGYGCCPVGMLPMLRKLGPQAKQLDYYRALAGVLKRGDACARAVIRSNEIDTEMIIALASLPDDEQSQSLIGALVNKPISISLVAPLVWIADRLTNAMPGSDICGQMAATTNPLKLAQQLAMSLPFPTPPFPASSRFVPIVSGAELHAVGIHLDNCLKDSRYLIQAVLDVLSGQEVFYRWIGRDETILIQLNRFAQLGWSIGDFQRTGDHLSRTPGIPIELVSYLSTLPNVFPGYSHQISEIFAVRF